MSDINGENRLVTERDVRQAVQRTIEHAMRADGTPEFFARFGAEDAAPAVLDCLNDLGVLRVPAP